MTVATMTSPDTEVAPVQADNSDESDQQSAANSAGTKCGGESKSKGDDDVPDTREGGGAFIAKAEADLDRSVPTLSSGKDVPEPQLEKPPFRLKLKHLLLPYMVGLTWILLHPAVSVVTGELKCRGIFVDESALEPNQLSIGPYPLEREWAFRKAATSKDESIGSGLCEAVIMASASSPVQGHRSRRRRIGGDRGAVECISHPGGFDVVLVVPPSAPVRPAESIVVFVPAPASILSWVGSDFHVSVLNLIDRLSDPGTAAWLAKNVLVVSPRIYEGSNATTLDESFLDQFLDAYLGFRNSELGAQAPPSLPPRYSSSILRTVLVLDVVASPDPSDGTGDARDYEASGRISLLPHGRRGVLPNLDLVFASVSVYRFMHFLKAGNGSGGARLWVHPYPHHHLLVEKFVNERVTSPDARRYASDLAGMALFALGMVVGPYPPHAPALLRGVDALTVRVELPRRQGYRSGGGKIDVSAAELLQRTEQFLRALSNTHERLHHSVSQYLLPSPFKFVSNGEYTYPAVFLVLPIVIRAATLALVDLSRFGFGVGIGATIAGMVTAATIGLASSAPSSLDVVNALLVLCYASSLISMKRLISAGSSFCHKEPDEDIDHALRRTARQSLQFMACLLAVYLHIPLLLSHVSLAVPSLLLWTPVLSFPRHNGKKHGVVTRALYGFFLVATYPSVAFKVMPVLLWLGYSPYVWGVYIPLHLVTTLTWIF